MFFDEAAVLARSHDAQAIVGQIEQTKFWLLPTLLNCGVDLHFLHKIASDGSRHNSVPRPTSIPHQTVNPVPGATVDKIENHPQLYGRAGLWLDIDRRLHRRVGIK